MSYLFLKMRRDIFSMYRQFIAVFLMAFMCLLIYSGMEGIWYGLQVGIDQYYEETDLADAWVYGLQINEKQIEDIENINGISSISTKLVADAKTFKDDESDSSKLRIIVSEKDASCKPKTIDGIDFDDTSEGMWLDSDFAKENDISIGDAVKFTLNGKEYELKVLGLVLSSEYVFYLESSDVVVPDHKQFGYCYINEKFADNSFGKWLPNKIDITYSDKYDEEYIKSEVESVLGKQFKFYLNRENVYSVKAVSDKILQIQKISVIYSSIFLFMAVLTIITTMRRIITLQKLQIGTLKALGYKKWEIMLHYSLYGTFVSLLGAGLGLLVGPRVISPILIETQLQFYRIPNVESHTTYISIALFAVVVIACTLATIFASKKSLREIPAELLRNNIPTASRHNILERFTRLWDRLSFSWQWIIRDISTNKVRFIMGMIGIIGCMVLLSAGFSLQDSAAYSNDYLYDDVFGYDVKLVVNEAEIKGEELNEYRNIQLISEGQIEIRYGGTESRKSVLVYDDGKYIKLSDDKGSTISTSDNSVIMTSEVAEKFGVEVGNKIEIKYTGVEDYVNVTVGAITKIPTPQGIILSKQLWEELGYEFTATSILSNFEDAKKLEDKGFVSKVVNKSEQKQSVDDFISSVATIFRLLIVAAILLCVIITYNLGAMSFSERHREYATLKVLGFRKGEITILTFLENGIIMIAGILVAIPVVYQFVNLFINIVSLETFSWLPMLQWKRLAQAVGVTVVSAIAANILLVRRIKSINMVESLKAME